MENTTKFNTENDLNIAIIKDNKDLLINENCCTCINIMLKNDGQILTSFLGSHNPYIVEQLEKAQKIYFKSLKKALKNHYFGNPEEGSCGCGGHVHHDCDCDDECECGDDKCDCGDNCECTPEKNCGCIDEKAKKSKSTKTNKESEHKDCNCNKNNNVKKSTKPMPNKKAQNNKLS